jgi:hypothetical protein
VIGERDWLSIDGGDSAIYIGRRETVPEESTAELGEVERWRRMVMQPAQ